MSSVLQQPIEYLSGIEPSQVALIKKELHLFTLYDLLHFFPFRYVDKSKITLISTIQSTHSFVQLRGRLSHIQLLGNGKSKRLSARLSDKSGHIELIWFKGISWLIKYLNPSKTYTVFGKPSRFNQNYNIAHPELSSSDEPPQNGLQAVYHSTEKLKKRGVDSKKISTLQRQVFQKIKLLDLLENIPLYVLDKYKLIDRYQAYKQIHFANSQLSLNQAIRRLKFEELFLIQLKILQLKNRRNTQIKGFLFKSIGNYFNTFYTHHLPFQLTSAQKRVLKEIRKDTSSHIQMNRLIQGDVGSGKTIVAIISTLMAIDNGFQSCIMAPTEILAQQHYAQIVKLLAPIGLHMDILTGSTPSKKKKELLHALAQGHIHVLVGTHALIEPSVQFKNIGLAVIDEQHKFGVVQRAKLWSKNTLPPHILVMTATPIPRTLAMTIYGDLDISIIDELPPGRKPIETVHRYDNKRLEVFGFIQKEIDKGRQAYIVYPLIEESTTLDYKDLEDGYESIVRAFPSCQVSIVHGKMKPKDKDYEMNRFAKGETQIMVATTVIEVGVNVPNASVMVIESAERFGLAQLHQLRGRVGRGAKQSFCILMTSFKLSKDGKKRIDILTQSSDGFVIAEEDLKIRGPGNIEGTKQSGILDLKIAHLSQDAHILKEARQTAYSIIKEDHEFKLDKHKVLSDFFRQSIWQKNVGWSKIS